MPRKFVRFQQHPDLPFGSGNFFDENGNDLGLFDDEQLANEILNEMERQEAARDAAGGAPPQPAPPSPSVAMAAPEPAASPAPVLPEAALPDLSSAEPSGMVPVAFSRSGAVNSGRSGSSSETQQTGGVESFSRVGALPSEMIQRQKAELEESARQYQERLREFHEERASGLADRASQISEKARDAQTEADAKLAVQQQRSDRAKREAQRVANTPIRPNRVWQDAGAAGQVAGIIGAFIADTAGYMMGSQQPSNILQEISDRDTQAQLANKESQVAFWARELGSVEAGIAAAELQKFKAVEESVNANLLEAQSQQEMQRGQLLIAEAKMRQKDAMATIEREAYGRETVHAQRSEQATRSHQQSLTESVQQSQTAQETSASQASGAKPNVLPVGSEDVSEEGRRALAAQWDPKDKSDAGQMRTYGKEMSATSKVRQLEEEIASLLGVKPDANGRYPDDAEGYSSAATGMWRPDMALWTDDEAKRVRLLKNKLAQLEVITREGWKTEPNGETKQIELSGVNRPTRDQDWGSYLNQLRDHRITRQRNSGSAVTPRVRAAWKLQRGFPLASQHSAVRPLAADKPATETR